MPLDASRKLSPESNWAGSLDRVVTGEYCGM